MLLTILTKARDLLFPAKEAPPPTSDAVREALAQAEATRAQLNEDRIQRQEDRLRLLLDADDETLDAIEAEQKAIDRELERLGALEQELQQRLVEAEEREAAEVEEARLAEQRRIEEEVRQGLQKYTAEVAKLVPILRELQALAEAYDGGDPVVRNLGRPKPGSSLPNGDVRLLEEIVLVPIELDAPAWNLLPGRAYIRPPRAEPSSSPSPEPTRKLGAVEITDGAGTRLAGPGHPSEVREDGVEVYGVRRRQLSRGPAASGAKAS